MGSIDLSELIEMSANARIYRYLHYCDNCSHAYDFTCSGAMAANCEKEKMKILESIYGKEDEANGTINRPQNRRRPQV